MLTEVERELLRTSPEQQGIASSAVLQFVEALESQIHEMHSFMLLRHGKVVAEGWWSPYRPEYPHMLFSISKSFTSTAVGLALSEGRFSIDDPVLSFFRDDAPAEVSESLAAMRLRHLLSMSTGHAEDSLAYMTERGDGNWIKGFFETPIRHAPGTTFLYDTGATYMLSAIVQKATGMKVVDYLKPRLFEPLGIETAAWDESPQGINIGGYGLWLKTEDVARFGQLYLQKGVWQGKQILPEDWVDEATAFQMPNGEDPESDWAQGYGYQFWRARHNAYRGDGVFGQYCIVMPEQDVVLAMTGGVDLLEMQSPLNLIWEILLPAMNSAPLAEDASAHQRLTEKLSSLSMLPVQGQATSPIASHVSEQPYQVDENGLSIEAITLSFAPSGCTIRIKTSEGEETIPCGYGTWEQGQTGLFDNRWLTGIKLLVASGAWTADDSFMMIIRLYETPFVHTLILHFAADEMIVEPLVNASFESRRPLFLTAHLV